MGSIQICESIQLSPNPYNYRGWGHKSKLSPYMQLQLRQYCLEWKICAHVHHYWSLGVYENIPQVRPLQSQGILWHNLKSATGQIFRRLHACLSLKKNEAHRQTWKRGWNFRKNDGLNGPSDQRNMIRSYLTVHFGCHWIHMLQVRSLTYEIYRVTRPGWQKP